eukprot:Hpha_TRINITY_DN16548_c1_g1::TRINITY_DN16548_c1_g1_i10::g.133406::m.133406/K02156/AUB, PIWI; aubergine
MGGDKMEKGGYAQDAGKQDWGKGDKGKGGKGGKFDDKKKGKPDKMGKKGGDKGGKGGAVATRVPYKELEIASSTASGDMALTSVFFNDRPSAPPPKFPTFEEKQKFLQMEDDKFTEAMGKVKRLGTGAAGNQETAFCNVLPLAFTDGPGRVYYQYEVVSVQGEQEAGDGKFRSRRMERRALHACLDQQEGVKGGIAYAQTSSAVLYTSKKLPEGDKITYIYQPAPDAVEKVLQQKITVKLNYSVEVPTGKITQPLITVIASIFRDCLERSDWQRIGRTYFRMEETVSIYGHQTKQLVSGLYTALHPIQHGMGLGMMVDSVKKCVATTDAWTEALKTLGGSFDPRKPADQQKLKNMWKDVVMLTTYDDKARKKRTFHVDDIIFTESEATKQDYLDGKTLKQYFKEAYGIDCPAGQPVLISKNLRRRDPATGKAMVEKYLPSICKVTGVPTRDPKTKSLREAMLKMCAVSPSQRYENLKSLLVKLVGGGSPWANESAKWGLTLQKGFSLVPVRRLPPPKLLMSGGWTKDTRDGSWNFDIDKRPANPSPTPAFFNMAHKIELGVIAMVPESRKDVFAGAMPQLQKSLGHLSGQGQVRILPVPLRTGFEGGAGERREFFKDARLQKADACIVFADATDNASYEAVKQEGIINHGKVSQVVRQKTLEDDRKLKAVSNKIATQLLVKLGNSAWVIENQKFPDAMVIGISFHHPASAEDRAQKSRTTAGVAATINDTMSQYAMAEAQQTGDDWGDELVRAFRQCLDAYKKKNGKYPKNFVFYRQGGSEGDTKHLLNTEVKAIRECIAGAAGADFKMAYFLVVRASHLRVVKADKGAEAGIVNLANPGFGTLLDHTFVHLNAGVEFFLVSQVVNQGCATAVKYKALHFDLGDEWTADKVQQLTFALSCMYYNWNGPIAVPAPCLYAERHARMFGDQLMDPSGAILQIPAGSKIRTNNCIPCL